MSKPEKSASPASAKKKAPAKKKVATKKVAAKKKAAPAKKAAAAKKVAAKKSAPRAKKGGAIGAALAPEDIHREAFFVYEERMRSGQAGDHNSDWEEATRRLAAKKM